MKWKQFASAALAASLLLGSPTTRVFAGETEHLSAYADAQEHWGASFIGKWSSNGTLNGYEDGTFRPDNTITRAEFVTVLNRVFGLRSTNPAPFRDVASGVWYATEVASAYEAGIIDGYPDLTFKPDAPISREDAALILASLFRTTAASGTGSNTLKSFADSSSISPYAVEAVTALIDTSILNGYQDSTLRPKGLLTRAETIGMIDRLAGELFSKPGKYSEKDELAHAVISVSDVTLSHSRIRGNLYLAPGIGEGDVTLDGITVDGRTYINGGGSNSIHVHSSQLKNVTAGKKNGNVRVVVYGGSSVEEMKLYSGVVLDVSKGASIRELSVYDEGIVVNGVQLKKGTVFTVSEEGAVREKEASNPTTGGSGTTSGSSPNPVPSTGPVARMLEVTAAYGSINGTTALTAVPAEGRHLAVQISHEPVAAPKYGDRVPSLLTVTHPYVSGSDLSGVDPTVNKYAAVYEVDSGNKITGFRQLVLTEGVIKADEWKMVWSDEFDQEAIDTSKWNFVTGGGGYGNEELQNYTSRTENARIENGALALEARKEVYGGNTYTSSKLTTSGKGDWTYGKFEIKAKLPSGKGIWPAIWMMPSDEGMYGAWPASGEMDIMELLGHEPGKIYGTLHYGLPKGQSQASYTLPDNGSFADDYHVFTMEWEPGEIRHYVDGILYSKMNDWYTKNQNEAAEYTYPAPFDRDFYLQLNLAVGGTWPGNPEDSTLFPQQMLVDYVRVYERDGAYREAVKRQAAEQQVREPDSNGNYIQNGGFQEGTSHWVLQPFAPPADLFGGEAALSIEGASEAKVAITREGEQTYAVQLVQAGVPLIKGAGYELSFDARSEGNRSMVAAITGPTRDYVRYMQDQTVALTNQTQTFKYAFTMESDTDAQARLEWNMGKAGTLPVYISNVKLVKTSDPDPNPLKLALPDGNALYNGTFDQGEGRFAYWQLHRTTEDAAAYSITNDRVNGKIIRELRVDISDQAKEAGTVKLVQDQLQLEAGKTYGLIFDARTDSPRSLEWKLDVGNPAALTLINGQSAELGTEMKTYSFDFSLTEGAVLTPGTLEFMLHGDPGTIYMDNVRLVKRGVPTTIEGYTYIPADQFWGARGVQVGGSVIGYLDEGDSFEYKLNVSRPGTYIPTVKVASDIENSYLRARLIDANGIKLWEENVAVGKTGGWNTNKLLTLEPIMIAEGTYYLQFGGDKYNTAAVELSPLLITNGSFEEQLNGWEFFKADWLPEVSPSYVKADNGMAEVWVSSTGTEEWNLQLKQLNQLFEKGKAYMVSFEAYSSVPRDMKAVVQHNGGDYKTHYEKTWSLTTERQTFADRFVMANETDANSLFQFVLGKVDNTSVSHTVYLDKVRLYEIQPEGDIGGGAGPEQPENVNLLPNADFAAGSQGWNFYSSDNGQLAIAGSDGKLRIDVGTSGTNPWDRQVYMEGITYKQGYQYTLSFKARSSKLPRSLNVSLGWLSETYAWTGYHSEIVQLSETEELYTIHFTVDSATNSNARVSFELGNITGGNTGDLSVWIDDISLVNNGPIQ